MKKTILLATDHAGFDKKNALLTYLKSLDCTVEDMGARTLDPEDDYPTFIAPLALRIATEPEKFIGIIFGHSGTGEAIVANRFPGVRAAVCYGGSGGGAALGSALDIVKLSREHNDANVLSIGAHFVSDDEMKSVVKLWLDTPFSGEERHVRRINEIDTIE